jgi:hypothetical protein
MPSQDAYCTQLKSPKGAFRIAGIYEKDFDGVFSKELSMNRERVTESRSARSFDVKIGGKAPVMSDDNAASPALYGAK